MRPHVWRVEGQHRWLFWACLLAGVVLAGGLGGWSEAFGKPRPGKPEVPQGVVLLQKTVGAGREELGCETLEEAQAQGPMSFAVAEDETIYVLDQVNGRIQVYRANTCLRSLPLPSAGAVDLEICPWGQLAMLDNLVEKALFVLDPTRGAVLHRIALEGRNIAYAPAATTVFCQAHGPYAGIWVEVDGRAVRVATREGLPDGERISLPGTLDARGETLVRAEIAGDVTVMLYRSTERSSQWSEVPVAFAARVDHLTAVSVDASGNAYLGAFLDDGKTFQNVLVKLDANGKELKRLKLPVQQRPEEVYRSLKVSGQGKVYQLLVEEDQVLVKRYEF